MTDIDLQPCPFCGSAAQLKRNRTVMVSCTNCTATTFQELADPDTAIMAWNRRASTPPPAAEPCAHRIADVRNKVVKSGYMCLDCGAVFAAADHDEPRASAAPAVQAVGEPAREALQQMLDSGLCCDQLTYIAKQGLAIQPPPSAKPALADPRPVVGIVDERYLRPTNGGER